MALEEQRRREEVHELGRIRDGESQSLSEILVSKREQQRRKSAAGSREGDTGTRIEVKAHVWVVCKTSRNKITQTKTPMTNDSKGCMHNYWNERTVYVLNLI